MKLVQISENGKLIEQASRNAGQDLQLTCDLIGTQAEPKWTDDKGKLIGKGRILTLTNLREESAGYILCIGENQQRGYIYLDVFKESNDKKDQAARDDGYNIMTL